MADFRSVGYSDVYILNQDDVTSILHEYPKDRLILLNTGGGYWEWGFWRKI